MATKKDTGETVADLLEGLSEEEIEDVKAFYGILFGEEFPPLDAPADEPLAPPS